MKQIRVILFVLLAAMAAFGQESKRKPETIRIEADPSSGFSYPFYLFIPGVDDGLNEAKPKPILVLPNNTGSINDDIEYHENSVKGKMLQAAFVFHKLNVPVLMPVFPRPKSHWKIYTHALDRDSLITKETTFLRFDLQLAEMIRAARANLNEREIRTEEKVLMYGFSASGMFVNRFVFLHPEIVKAAAIGSPGGWPIAPIEELDGNLLRYPIGVADLESVSGRKFEKAMVAEVPLFLFLGNQDENDSVVFRDGYEEADEKLIFRLFGARPVDRWTKIGRIYKSAGLNAEFKLYEDAGHSLNNDMRNDVLNFLTNNID